MMKQLQLLCTGMDEESLSRLLLARYPSVVVIDGSRWETPEPPVVLSRVDNVLIGPDAASWWSIEEGRLLMDRSTENYFAPASGPAEE